MLTQVRLSRECSLPRSVRYAAWSAPPRPCRTDFEGRAILMPRRNENLNRPASCPADLVGHFRRRSLVVLSETGTFPRLVVGVGATGVGAGVAVAVGTSAVGAGVAVAVAGGEGGGATVGAVGVGAELLGELLLLGDGVLDGLLLRGHVVLVLLLLGGDELLVLLLLGLHELLALGLSLGEGLLLGLTDLLDLLGGHAVGAVGVRAVATEGGGGTVGSGAVGEGTTVVRGSVGSERHL